MCFWNGTEVTEPQLTHGEKEKKKEHLFRIITNNGKVTQLQILLIHITQHEPPKTFIDRDVATF